MSATRPPRPGLMSDEDSCVAAPSGTTSAVKRTLGRYDDEGTQTKSVPLSPAAAPRIDGGRGRRTPPATVGLRAAPKQRLGAPEKLEASMSQVRDTLEANKEQRKQRVWDKLDAAKKQAEEKLGRLNPFRPQRPGRGGAR